MRVLVWNSLWPSQSQPLFFAGCFKEHLIPQANLLSNFGWEVFVAYPDYLSDTTVEITKEIQQISIPFNDLGELAVVKNPLGVLYENPKGEFSNKVKNYLEAVLPKNIDIILTWENPIPFLEILYPNALIINQMPGSFSRAPYPHLITFEPVGLYKNSILSSIDREQNFNFKRSELELYQGFRSKAEQYLSLLSPMDRKDLVESEEVNCLSMLPLQVSAHYAFTPDSKFSNQIELMADVFQNRSLTETVLVTQYKSSFTSDTPINKSNYNTFKKWWPSLTWKPEFDMLPSPSQLLLPMVDKVISFSSSLIFQAMLLGKQIEVPKESYFHSFRAELGEEIEKNNNIVKFLLNRYQVSAKAIRTDQTFLTTLLKEMLKRKKAGKSKIDLLPSYTDIDKNYAKKYLSSFEALHLLKSIGKINSAVPKKFEILNKFNSLINKKNISCVSFDIFDTLVTRPVDVPISIFEIVQSYAESEIKQKLPDFSRIRVWAEQKARKTAKLEEISLKDIYFYIQDYYQLTKKQASKLQQIEIATEKELIIPRSLGQQLWLEAKNSGKEIILISDMYLPKEAIKAILDNCGYFEPYKLFLSSEERATKHKGSLYAIALTKLNFKGDEIIHVGDNRNNDVKMAEQYGIKSFFLPSSIFRIQTNNIYTALFPKKIKGEQGKNYAFGLIANRLFESYPTEHESKTLFSGDPWRLGYAGMGALFTGFIQWIAREAKRDNISQLYFLSREGFILKAVYDALYGGDKNYPQSNYLYCSRRASRVAALETKQDICATASLPYHKDISLEEIMLHRFGIEINQIEQKKLNVAGITNTKKLLDNDIETRIWFSAVCDSLSAEILKLTKNERQAYQDYISKVGINSTQRPAIVDLGWKGNMQIALSELINKPLTGYYFATLSGVLDGVFGNKIYGYVGEKIGSKNSNIIVKNRKLLELLTCHTEESLIKFTKSYDGHLTPVFMKEINLKERQKIVGKIHDGILAFAYDYKRSFQNISPLGLIDFNITSTVLEKFLTNPTLHDAKMIEKLYFEDSFSGLNSQNIMDSENIWGPGAEVIRKSKQIAIKNTKNDLQSLQSTRNQTKVIEKIERFMVHRIEKSPKKIRKFDNNPQKYWTDSKNPAAQYWNRFRMSLVGNKNI